MENLQFRRYYSNNVLLRMILFAAVIGGVVYWNLDFIRQVYFENQITQAGYAINGFILALFGIGVLRLIGILASYAEEEAALRRFVRNLEQPDTEPLRRVAADSIIARRYRTMRRLFEAHAPINHGALASTLVATESTRNGLPRFINNVLILNGVFGTVVSLAIALVGASNILETSVNIEGMGMVMHGLSTAPSATITAILCYLFFNYFYIKLNDVQTNLVSGVEQVTTYYLAPKFQVQEDTVLYELAGMIRSLQSLVRQMDDAQHSFDRLQKQLGLTLDTYSLRVQGLGDDLEEIKRVLKTGFRLPDAP